MRARIVALFVSTALLSALPALATDLTISADGIVEYDDNAFRSSQNEEDDFFFRIRPEIKIHEDRGQDWRYHLRYAIPFEFAVENDELDDIDHVLDGQISYHASDRLELYISDRFRSLRGGTRNIVVEDDATNDQLVNSERDRVTLNDVNGGISYLFSPRVSGHLNISHSLFTSSRSDRADNYHLSGTGDLSFVLDPKHTLAAGLQVTHQNFDSTVRIEGSQVMSYYLFGKWSWHYDETTEFQISVGPSYLDSQQDDPPAQVTAPLVPSVTLSSPVTLTGGEGWRLSDGSLAVGTFDAGSVIVSQVGSGPPAVTGCPTVGDGSGGTVKVLPGAVCPFGGFNPAPVILDVDDNAFLGDDLLINEVQTQTVTLANANPSGDDSSSIDVFAEVVLTKRWTPNFASALRYSRSQGGASGLGGAVVRDAVNLSNNWQISEKWEFFIRGDWTLRQSVTEATATFDTVTVGTSPLGAGDWDDGTLQLAFRDQTTGVVTVRDDSTNIDTMRWGVASRLTHRFSRNTSAWLQLTYNQQESTGGTLGNVSDFENFLGAIGVRHVFDPIKLW